MTADVIPPRNATAPTKPGQLCQKSRNTACDCRCNYKKITSYKDIEEKDVYEIVGYSAPVGAKFAVRRCSVLSK